MSTTFAIHTDEIKDQVLPMKRKKGRRRSIMKKRHSIGFSSSQNAKKMKRNKRVSFGARAIREFNEEDDQTVDLPLINIGKMLQKGTPGMDTFYSKENVGPNQNQNVPRKSALKIAPTSSLNRRLSKSPGRKGLSSANPPAIKIVEISPTSDSSAKDEFFSPRQLEEATMKLTEEEMALVKQFDLQESTGELSKELPFEAMLNESNPTSNPNESVLLAEEEDIDVDMSEQTMEMTVNVGQILPTQAQATPESKGPIEANILNISPSNFDAADVSMEMTKNVGEILAANNAALSEIQEANSEAINQITSSIDVSIENTTNTLDASMEMTKNIGEILSTNNPITDAKHDDVNQTANTSITSDGSSMEMTRNVGEILAAANAVVAEPEEDIEVNVQENTNTLDASMEMTKNVGEILSANPVNVSLDASMEMTKNVSEILSANPVIEDVEEEKGGVELEEMTMEMTKNVGEILQAKEASVDIEEKTMEMTENVGQILSEKDDAVDQAAAPDVSEQTMEFTQNFVEILSASKPEATEEKEVEPEVEVQGTDLSEMTMEMTKNVGEIMGAAKAANVSLSSKSPGGSVNSTQTIRDLLMDAEKKDLTIENVDKILNGDSEDKTCELPNAERFGETTRNIEELFGKIMNGEDVNEDETQEITQEVVVEVKSNDSMVEEEEEEEEAPAVQEEKQLVSATPTPSKNNLSMNMDMSMQQEEETLMAMFFDRTGVKFPRIAKRRPSSFGTVSNWPPTNLSEMIEFSITGLVTELKTDIVSSLTEHVSKMEEDASEWEQWLSINKMPSLLTLMDESPESETQFISSELQALYGQCRRKARLELARWERENLKDMRDTLMKNHHALVSDRVRIYDIIEAIETAENDSTALSDLDALKAEVMSQAAYINEMCTELEAKKASASQMQNEITEVEKEKITMEKRLMDGKKAYASREELDTEESQLIQAVRGMVAATGIELTETGLDKKSNAETFSLSLCGAFNLNIHVLNGKVPVANVSFNPEVEMSENGDMMGGGKLKAEVLEGLFNSADTQEALSEILSDLKEAGASSIHNAVEDLNIIAGRFAMFADEASSLHVDELFNMKIRNNTLRILATDAKHNAQIFLDFPLGLGYPSQLPLNAHIESVGDNAMKHKLFSETAVRKFSQQFGGCERLTTLCRAVRDQLSL